MICIGRLTPSVFADWFAVAESRKRKISLVEMGANVFAIYNGPVFANIRHPEGVWGAEVRLCVDLEPDCVRFPGVLVG